ncbi:hypothetical protein RFM68_24960 [Mesorhizobium sp. MSK_1335]|uniref:Thymidylate kinase-like domain-containing protein n=1 Tax=Mesorhizobium montanum TaxID=3072323 RepID=A0ABU4ZRY6_9HYPH|nr:hypothetical protein [Mesorhizobium sp. MSK_1335]MDX8527755.1 hypothetical protein [Mesorhizobium sp. MSK_1335]
MGESEHQTQRRLPQPRTGRLVVLEGPNEVGKTTISQALAHWLNERGTRSEVHSFPGRSPGSLGLHVHRLHHTPREFDVQGVSPTALQALHVAAHLDAIESIILPKLGSGINVILDRYWWSTVAYGTAAGVSKRLLESLISTELIAWGGQVPTLVVVLDRDTSVLRVEQTSFIGAVREQYRNLVQSENRRYPTYIVNNDGTVENTTAKIASLLEA